MDIILLLLLFLAFFLIGDKIRAWWRLPFTGSAEAIIICTALGLVTVSCATTLLAFLGLLYPAAAWAILGFVYLSSIKRLSQLARGPDSPSPSPAAKMEWFDLFNLAVLFILLFLALTLAQTPPTRTDTLIYHLAVPKAYLEHHGIINLPNNVASFLPMQMEMIYLFCLMMGSEIVAKLTGLGMAVLLLFALTLFYKRNLSSRYATLVPVLLFSTPTFFELSTTAYVDLAVAGFVFLAYYAWDRWRMESAWIFPLAVFAGAAVATKLTAIILLPVALIGILTHKQSPGSALKAAFLLISAVLLFMLPWWARNHHYTGNPFGYLLMHVFGGEDKVNWDMNRALLMDQFVKSFGMGRGIKDFFLLPINLTFFSEKNGFRFDGQIGILYLLLFPGLFFLRRGNASIRKHVLPLSIVFGVLLVFWFSRFQYIRFLASPFAFLALLMTYGFSLMRRRIGMSTRHIAFALAAGAITYNLGLVFSDWRNAEPLSYLAGNQTREQYLARHIPVYPMYRVLNRTLGKDDIALLVHMRNLGYLIERKFIGDSLIEAHTLKTILEKDPSIDGVSRQLREKGITHLMFDDNFVFGKDSAFSPEQLVALKNFLNSRAKLVEGKNGFYLYRFMVD